MYGNGRQALADAMDICAAELDMLIDRHFAANRTLVVEPEGTYWTASIGDTVLVRARNRDMVLRFARTFVAKNPSVLLEYAPEGPWSVKVPDNVFPIGGAA